MMQRVPGLVAVLALLTGCAGQLKDIGRAPEMSAVGAGLKREAISVPTAHPRDEYVSSTGSIWQDTSADLFRDPSARHVGDTLTVRISIKDKATLNSSSDRSRASTRDFGFNIDHEVSFAGWSLMQNSPASGSSDVDSASTHKGEGETKREETIDFVLAAVVTDVLPNGNLIVRGSQEVRVNYEVRILQVAGIVRPRDIEQDNSISYDKIAEARISYGGRGRISEVQQPGIGQQLLDIITPF